MLRTYEIREKEFTTRPNLLKFGEECKSIVDSELGLKDDESEMHFQTTELGELNDGYVVGCRIDTHMHTYYFIFDDSKYKKTFYSNVKSFTKIRVNAKIKEYTTRTQRKVTYKFDKNGKYVLNANGSAVHTMKNVTEKVWSLPKLEYAVLGDHSKTPVDKDSYLKVLKAVYDHFNNTPEFIKSLCTDEEIDRYKFLMKKLNEYIEEIDH